MRFALVASALALVSAIAGAHVPGRYWRLPHDVAPPVVPLDNAMSKAKVELGRRLFYDADLSIDGTMSCATCHEQRRAFADGNATHPGATGQQGRRNVPGLANVGWFSPLTFADPGMTSLEDQVAVPVFGTHPVEMGMKAHEAEISARLSTDDCYRMMFAKAFPEQGGRIDFAAVAKALASFERTLISYSSNFDRGHLTAQARAGQAVFQHDCAGCHIGPNFTDLAFHRLGRVDPVAKDPGLSEASGKAADFGRFRTPSLRNIALTAPYWHDGSAPTLAAAIDRHGLNIRREDQAMLVAFLNALTDMKFVNRKSLALPSSACGREL